MHFGLYLNLSFSCDIPCIGHQEFRNSAIQTISLYRLAICDYAYVHRLHLFSGNYKVHGVIFDPTFSFLVLALYGDMLKYRPTDLMQTSNRSTDVQSPQLGQIQNLAPP